ncbi:MAG TPA: PadR family transcriptional regulator [Actinomycetota bacterium]|jgi:DNA-binding PadR family transcriptional regulator|nr:PadR family transcriptional regulator [Actinomycetota bacterium]
MIELAILGLLKEQPMHGYQLNRELSEQLGGLWRVSYGSLYPSLRRLERQGAITSVQGTGARRKTVYAITPEGERLFLELLEETPQENQTEDARFRVRLAFFRYLPPETRVRLLERRRQALETRLADVKAHLRDDAGTTDDYQRALLDHARAGTESDIAWLTELIRTERLKYEITAPVGERRRASATLRRKERTS